MSEIEALQRAIAALESQRSLLGDSTVDIALAPLREQLLRLQREAAPDQQLKYVSVLFTDIVGSTHLGQSLDPEDTLAVMNGALQRFKQVIEQHGGRVTRFMGDGLKAIFGIPRAAEDDAERAVKAGLALLQTAKDYAQQVEETWRLSGFNIRVGINTGQVLVGGGVEQENTAMGIAINLAARMESAAPVGSLLISENTYQHVRGRFELLAQAPILVKGIDQPVRTYQVLQASLSPFRAPGRGIQGIRTELVGREVELARLQEAYRELFQLSYPRLITILGEAGVGKSRLLAEFESWRAQQPGNLHCFMGRAAPHTLASPYGLLRELFARNFNILESDPLEQARLKLEDGLAGYLAEESQMKAHFIGALLGFDFNSSPHLHGVLGDPGQISQRGLFYLNQYFANVARSAPTLILLEDIHWADPPSLDFIQALLGSLSERPVLVICLARRALLENFPNWPLAGSSPATECSHLVLNPLSEANGRKLVGAILRMEQLPETLVGMIVQQAEGNPYYIEELINVLIDDGVILTGEESSAQGGHLHPARDTSEAWQINASRLAQLRIPPSLTTVLQARLDGLVPAEKNVIQRAAVIGRTFWDQPLQIMLAAASPPENELDRLSRRGLIHPNALSTFAGVGEYAFGQNMLREVAYETVLKRDRQRYHANVAAWLAEITQASGRSDEHLALIAEHYDRAGDSLQAAGWYLRAGQRALTQGAPRQARGFFDRALELLPASEQESRWLLLLGRNEALGVLGERLARQADDQALLSLAQQAGNESWLAEAYYRTGVSATSCGDERSALQAYQTAIAIARNTSEQRLVALSLALAAISQTRLGDMHGAGQSASQALELSRLIDDDKTLAYVLTNVAVHYSEIGDLSRAQELLQEQIRSTHRLGNRLGEAVGLSNLGYGYTQLGEYTAAQTALDESLRLAQAIGARQYQAYAQLNLGLVHWRMGNFAAAAEILEQPLLTLAGITDQFGRAAGLIYLALVQEAGKDYLGASQNYTEAEKILAAMGMHTLASDAIAGLARCALGSSHPEPARQHATDLWAYLVETSGKGMEFPILAYLTCAEVFSTLQEITLSQAAVQAGRHELMERAQMISDPHWRNAYLQNVPEHAAIIARWERLEA